MTWFEKIIAAHTAVTDQVSHAKRLRSDRYFVWQEEGETPFMADGKHAEIAVKGTTDLFTKMEFDPWKEAFERELDASEHIAWSLNAAEYEPETGFFHFEWIWRVM